MIRNLLIMYGGIALFGAILVLMDWLGRRQERRSHKH